MEDVPSRAEGSDPEAFGGVADGTHRHAAVPDIPYGAGGEQLDQGAGIGRLMDPLPCAPDPARPSRTVGPDLRALVFSRETARRALGARAKASPDETEQVPNRSDEELAE